MKHYLILLLCCTVCWIGCDPQEVGTGNTDCRSSQSQEAVFAQLADQLIVPAYAQLLQSTTVLQSATADFTAAPSTEGLAALQTAFHKTYLDWQYAAPYQFGPAEEVFLRSSFNNFPLDENALTTRLDQSNHNFEQPDTYDKGLPALDYLLFAQEEAQLTYLTDTPGALSLLDALVKDLYQRAQHVHAGWTEGYREVFVNNSGTAAGTSLNLVINQLNQHYEGLKRDKIGLPAGVLTIGIANPTKVEAYYSGQSVVLARAALRAAEYLYQGQSREGGNGTGLDDYLLGLNTDAARRLDEDIRSQFAAAEKALADLDGPLSELVQSDNARVLDAYAEVSRQLINIKTDLPALTCISITYIDNPSDSD